MHTCTEASELTISITRLSKFQSYLYILALSLRRILINLIEKTNISKRFLNFFLMQEEDNKISNDIFI